MTDNPLREAVLRAEYFVSGHGPRNVQVLKDALAAVEGDVASDAYGSGKVIADFEAKVAQVLGKERAVFFPSGTMAQQIALRIWCDEKGLRTVAYHPLCHLELHEEDGLKELHGIKPILLADRDRLIEFQDVAELHEDIACLLLELPQREIGGQLPSFEELRAISAFCRDRGIRVHMDGARLWQVLPYYEKTAAEVSSLFDSVYVSFYKGIGGVAGAILAGPESFMNEAKVWKRRHGGDLISLYPYIISADYYFDKRIGRMGEYYRGAVELAGLYNEVPGLSTRPGVPVSNMFHVHANVSREELESILAELCDETGVALASSVKASGDGTSYYEVSVGDRYATVPREKLLRTLELLGERVGWG